MDQLALDDARPAPPVGSRRLALNRDDVLHTVGWLLALSTLADALWAPWADPWFGLSGMLAVGIAWGAQADSTRGAIARSFGTALGALAGYLVMVGVVYGVLALLDRSFDLQLVADLGGYTSTHFGLAGLFVGGLLGGVARSIRLGAARWPVLMRLLLGVPFALTAVGHGLGAETYGMVVVLVAAIWLDRMVAAAPTSGSSEAYTPRPLPPLSAHRRATFAFVGLGIVNAALFVGVVQTIDGPAVSAIWDLVRPGAAGVVAVAILLAARGRTAARAFGGGLLALAVCLVGGTVLITGYSDGLSHDRPWSNGVLWVARNWSGAVDWGSHQSVYVPWEDAVLLTPTILVLWFLPVLGPVGRAYRLGVSNPVVLRAMLLAPFAMIVASAIALRMPVSGLVAAAAAIWLDRSLRPAAESTNGP